MRRDRKSTSCDIERYEARHKFQLDYNTGMDAAHLKGEKTGVIQLCERLLNRPETATEQLKAMSLEELALLADNLQAQLQIKK